MVAYASLRGEPPDRRARPRGPRLASTRGRPPARGHTLDDIQDAAAAAFGLTARALLARDRTPRVAFARQVAMYLARELTDETLPAIGRRFGGRNHTTVLHAHRRISADPEHDAVDHEVDAVRRRLAPDSP